MRPCVLIGRCAGACFGQLDVSLVSRSVSVAGSLTGSGVFFVTPETVQYYALAVIDAAPFVVLASLGVASESET